MVTMKRSDTLHERNITRRAAVSPCHLDEKLWDLADSNTKQGIETTGLLLGSRNSDSITIVQLILPKQNGAPNEVIMLNDEYLDTRQLDSGLVTMGWIHTRPIHFALFPLE